MKKISICMLGFGNVGKSFARLLINKADVLQKDSQLRVNVIAIATASHGRVINHDGINLLEALQCLEDNSSLNPLQKNKPPDDNLDFIQESNADVLLENTPVNHQTGQPAIDHVRVGLTSGMHVITANKGPVAFGYRALSALAETYGRRFMFESAVMDGAPIFSLFRETLPAVAIKGFHGILNSCTNFILGRMEDGISFEEAVEEGRRIGITETDPSADIDGWDAAIKISALTNVLLGETLLPCAVRRSGIRDLTSEMVMNAKNSGQRWKLVCQVVRNGKTIHARVEPKRVKPTSPMYSINGTSSYIEFETDVLPGLGIVESNPGPQTTAYGLLADLIHASRVE